jgi:hypothetical protein
MSEEKKKVSNIAKELKRLESQIEDIYQGLESIVLKDIEEPEARIRAATAKAGALKLIPVLLTALDDLRNKNKLKQDDIKGSASLSPLDDGTLND